MTNSYNPYSYMAGGMGSPYNSMNSSSSKFYTQGNTFMPNGMANPHMMGMMGMAGMGMGGMGMGMGMNFGINSEGATGTELLSLIKEQYAQACTLMFRNSKNRLDHTDMMYEQMYTGTLFSMVMSTIENNKNSIRQYLKNEDITQKNITEEEIKFFDEQLGEVLRSMNIDPSAIMSGMFGNMNMGGNFSGPKMDEKMRRMIRINQLMERASRISATIGNDPYKAASDQQVKLATFQLAKEARSLQEKEFEGKVEDIETWLNILSGNFGGMMGGMGMMMPYGMNMCGNNTEAPKNKAEEAKFRRRQYLAGQAFQTAQMVAMMLTPEISKKYPGFGPSELQEQEKVVETSTGKSADTAQGARTKQTARQEPAIDTEDLERFDGTGTVDIHKL